MLLTGTYGLTVIMASLVLLILGTVGIDMKTSESLYFETQSLMQRMMQLVDPRYDHLHSKEIVWLQKRFSCCGLTTFGDWKSILKLDYYGYNVPDSCCINMIENCGRKPVNFVGNGVLDRSHIIYTSGCLAIYYKYFSNDISFLSVISICISVVLLFDASLLIYGYLVYSRILHGQAKNRACSRGANVTSVNADEEDIMPMKESNTRNIREN